MSGRETGGRRRPDPRQTLRRRVLAPWALALLISLVLFKNRKEILLQFMQVMVVFAPILAIWKIRALGRHWRPALAFAASAALSALALHLAGPLILHRLVLPLYNLNVDHRYTPWPGHRNEDGVRPDVSPSTFKPGDFNIVFLGDSMTEGLGLERPEKQAFPFLIEQQLRAAHPGKEIRVADFGWSSSSPLLENRQLRQIGAKYHPKLVVQVFDMTDFQNDIDYTNELRRVNLERPAELSIFRAMMVRFSLLLGVNDFVKYLGEKTAWRCRRAPAAAPAEIHTPKPSRNSGFEGEYFFMWIPLAEAEPYFAYSWQAILATNETAKSLGAKFAFFVLPRYQQYNRREAPKDKKRGQIPPFDDYLFGVFQYFDRQAQTASFPVRQLLREFQTATEFPLNFEDDFHPSENGHRVAGRAILQDLQQDGMLDELK